MTTTRYLVEADPQPMVVCADCGGVVAESMVADHEALHIALGLLGELVAQDVFPAPPELLDLAERAGLRPDFR